MDARQCATAEELGWTDDQPWISTTRARLLQSLNTQVATPARNQHWINSTLCHRRRQGVRLAAFDRNNSEWIMRTCGAGTNQGVAPSVDTAGVHHCLVIGPRPTLHK